MDGNDRIEIRGVRAYGYHGVLEHERRDGQMFVVDATLWVDLREAGSSDELSHTVHYGEVSEELAAAVSGTRFRLIEALAEHLAGLLLRRDRVRRVEVRVAKPAAPVRADVGEIAVVVQRP